MNTPTDQQLKQALAKMLPSQLTIDSSYSIKDCECDRLRWKFDSTVHRYRIDLGVLDTELLHICWLIERTLSANDARVYAFRMSGAEHTTDHEVSRMMVFKAMNASWQQRTLALAKVKGVEIV